MNSKRLKPKEDRLKLRRMKILSDFLKLGMHLRGSICTLKRPCIRKRCARCKKGKNHPTVYLSLKQRGKTTLVYLPAKIQPTVKKYIKHGEQVKILLDKLMECNIELLRREIKKIT